MFIIAQSNNFTSTGELKEISPKYASTVENDGILNSPYSDVYRSATWDAPCTATTLTATLQPSHIGGWGRSRRKSQLTELEKSLNHIYLVAVQVYSCSV